MHPEGSRDQQSGDKQCSNREKPQNNRVSRNRSN